MLQPLRPADLSAIEYEFLLGRASETYPRVLVARFSGLHRPGASGAPDTRAVEAFLALGMTLFRPDALVLDLAGLDYPGGPMLKGAMTPVLPSLEEGFPFYVVASPSNRAALVEAVPEPAIVETVEAAFDRIAATGPWAAR